VVADISPRALDVHGPVLVVNREELEQVSEHVVSVVRELLARVSADFSLESLVLEHPLRRTPALATCQTAKHTGTKKARSKHTRS
jgi:hypothetical protein